MPSDAAMKRAFNLVCAMLPSWEGDAKHTASLALALDAFAAEAVAAERAAIASEVKQLYRRGTRSWPAATGWALAVDRFNNWLEAREKGER